MLNCAPIHFIGRLCCMFIDDVGFEGCIWMHPPIYYNLTRRVHSHFPGTEQEAARCRYKNQIRAVTLLYEVLKTEKLRRTGPSNQCLWVGDFLRKMQGDDHFLTPRSVPSGCWVCPTPSCWSLTPSCPWLSEKSSKSHCRVGAKRRKLKAYGRDELRPCARGSKNLSTFIGRLPDPQARPRGYEMLHVMSCSLWKTSQSSLWITRTSTDWIAEKYRWNMAKQETRNTQLFRTIYQDDSLFRCKTATVRDDPDALSVVYCELQAPVGPRASLSGMIALVDAKAGPHLNRAMVCPSVPGLVIYENEACSSWLLMGWQRLEFQRWRLEDAQVQSWRFLFSSLPPGSQGMSLNQSLRVL